MSPLSTKCILKLEARGEGIRQAEFLTFCAGLWQRSGCYVTWLSFPQRPALSTHLSWPRGRASVGGHSYKDSREIKSFWFSLEMARGWPQTLGPNLVLGSAPERTHTLSVWIIRMGRLAFKTTRAPSRQEQTPGLASSKNVFLWNPSRMEIASQAGSCVVPHCSAQHILL